MHKASYYIQNDSLFIISDKGEHKYFYQPICSPDNVKKNIEIIIDYCNELSIPPVIEECSNDFIEEARKSGFEFQRTERRDQWEYVYSVDAMISLKGKELHRKKNRFNKFVREHPDYTLEELKPVGVEEILDFHRYWCRLKNCSEDSSLKSERIAIEKLLGSMSHLPVSGVIILDKGRVKGFSIGTRLRDGIFVIMVEKAELLPEYEGIYACLNTETARYISTGYNFINRQQDMGIAGLRKTKLSWKPEKLLVCDTISLMD